jgi:hypothetical protein
MKAVHIVLLVLAGALGGAVLMKVAEKPRQVVEEAPVVSPVQPVAQQAEVSPAPTVPAPAPAPAPAVQEVQPPVTPPAASEPPAKPSPLEARQQPARPQEPVHARPFNPRPLTMVAKIHPPATFAAPPAPQPAPPVASVSPDTAAPPVPASEPVTAPVPDPLKEVQEMRAPQPTPPARVEPENVTPPLPPPPLEGAVPNKVTLNAGLLIPVRLVDGLSSERNVPGDTFTATLDRELVVDGFVIAERGARAEGRVVSSDRGGKTAGVAALSVELTRIYTSDGQTVPIQTESFRRHSDTSHGQDAAKIGGGAALGAAIGAMAGGGKGAAIGAGVGGGAGTADVLLTRGKPATLPSETRLTFRLRIPVTLTERRG